MSAPSPSLAQWLYMLRLVPGLHDESAWTPTDESAASAHFHYLQEAARRGQVILAGRTLEPGERTFGLCIFEASDEAAAQAFMANDPAILGGVMTATLHPYRAAILRDNLQLPKA